MKAKHMRLYKTATHTSVEGKRNTSVEGKLMSDNLLHIRGWLMLLRQGERLSQKALRQIESDNTQELLVNTQEPLINTQELLALRQIESDKENLLTMR